MASAHPQKWLLLVHQLPPKPNALRVRIWRRLQQVGAVAIKQSVYIMPLCEQSREDLSWTLKQIVEGGGDGSISEVRFVEGLSDEQIVTLFQNARKSDYEKLTQESNTILENWTSGAKDPKDPASKSPAQFSRMQRRLDDIIAIDFFMAPKRATAKILIKELRNFLWGHSPVGDAADERYADLIGKIWVTRKNLFVDRIACGWLIRRFIDQTAVFKFVSGAQYSPGPGEIRFDMFDGEYTHEGDRCSFEVMIQRLRLQDHALAVMAEVVHDIDLKDGKYSRCETDGFKALLAGLVASQRDDDLRMVEGHRLFENLYTYFHHQKRD